MSPLISIVTPSFQQAPFLRACLDSILNQDYPNLECIVMDGGSTDGSVEILKEFDDRITWTSGKDGGQAAALNQGFSQAKGSILGYLNSDDRLLPGALQSVAKAFRENPSADVVYGRAELIDRDGEPLALYPTVPFEREVLYGDCFICQPAAFWRRETADRIGSFEESLHATMDYDFWIRIARADGFFLYLEEVLAQSRDYPETKTRSNRARVFHEIFSLSRRHLGGIHPRWIDSYLQHLRTETNLWWRRIIPRSEKNRRPMVRLITAFSRSCR